MRPLAIPRLCLFVMITLFAAAQTPAPTSSETDWSVVEKTLGRPGKVQPDGACKVGFPRTDLHVTIGKTPLEPAAGLGSWAAFDKQGATFITNGDLAVLETEVAPVSKALQAHGLEITALHNHLTGEHPSVFFIHFFGQGQLQQLLDGVKSALAASATPVEPASATGTISYDRPTIEKIMEKQGTPNGPVLSFAFPPASPIAMHGLKLPASMGMATSINFQPSPAGVAATGDFVLKEHQVRPVTAALRDSGLTVTAIHNHMLDDNPHIIFVHFWGEGKPADIALALKSALQLASW